MVCHQILVNLLVFDLQVKLLKEKHPLFSHFLGGQVFRGRMISVDNDLASQDVRLKLLEYIDYRQKLFLHSRLIYLRFDEGLACIAYGH